MQPGLLLRRINVSAVLGLVALVALGGCAAYAPTVPEGYAGPVAVIKDSVTPYSERKADFFYVSEIDGKPTKNSRIETLNNNRGRGLTMTPSVIERDVPTQEATFTLVGRTEYAAPILALTHAVYQVTGKLTFSPEAHRSYVVRGELGEKHSAVWLEDEATGAVVGDKIEVNGSSKLGFFEK